MSTYTPNQIDAIHHGSGNLQILACAGSGKTEVISRRVARLVSQGVPKSAIVAFTFTDRAADELKARIRSHLQEDLPEDPSIGDMYVGTIHSFCLRLLKDLQPAYRKYEVIDEARQTALIMRNYQYFPQNDRGIGLDALRHRTRTKGYWDTIRTFINTINIIHQKNIAISDIRDSTLKDCVLRYRRIAYDEPNFFFDFDEIIGKLIDELKSHTSELRRWRNAFQYLIVDEYQDIDDRQEELISLLSNRGRDVHVTVVGDDDQAIYGWRGARIHNILEFSDRYHDVTQIRLTYNFRSTHAIAEIADAAIRRIPEQDRLAKTMEARHWDEMAQDFVETLAHQKDIRVRSLPSEEDEAHWVAKRIAELRGALIQEPSGSVRAIDYGDMAILLRSVKGSGRLFTNVLKEHKIPVVVTGIGGLFDHQEVQLMQATFSLLARTYMLKDDGDGLRRLHEAELRDFVRYSIRQLRDGQSAMPYADEGQYLQWIAAKREELDRRSLEKERRGRLARRIYPQDIFQQMLKQLGIDRGPQPWPSDVLYNLGKLSGLITDYESVHQWISPTDLGGLCLFLGGWAASQVDQGGLEESVTTNAVQIMTVHASKGLEWPVVFVPRVSSSNFPSSLRNRGPSTFLDEGAFDSSDYASGDDGERRLWYVALTRCRRFLNVSSPDRKNKRPTTYMKEIHHDYVTRDDVADELDKDEPIPPANAELLPTTYTELSYYWRCPFEYQLRALMGFQPGVKESYGYGQQIHNVLAEIHQSARDGNVLTVEEIEDLVDRRFHLRYTRDGDTYKPLTSLRNAAKESILRYLRQFPDAARYVLDAEKPFEFFDNNSGALISGTIDLIQRIDTTPAGEERRTPVAIVDFKTHSWKNVDSFVTRRHEVEAQLRLYAVAAGQALGFETQQAFAHFLSPKGPSEDLLAQGVSERVNVDVSESAQDDTSDRVRRTVVDIQDGVKNDTFAFSGASSGKCPTCDFRSICPGYRQWKETDTTTPRPESPEAEREREMLLVDEDLHAR